MTPVEAALTRRLREMAKSARMWGSPEELEAVGLHFAHVFLRGRDPAWALPRTFDFLRALGAPFAADAEAHALMRSGLWREEEALARGQVVQGYAVVWAGLARDEAKEARVGPWVEVLLDAPETAGTPDRLNMVLFALVGFVARDATGYVQALSLERARVGGHPLRPLPVVAPPGPSLAGLSWARDFESWPRVAEGLDRLAQALESLQG